MNKKILNIISLFAVLIVAFPLSAYADESIKVNNIEVSKGDIVTYEFYMGGVDDAIEAAGAYIKFNPDYLEYADGSIGFDVFHDVMMNVGEGSIYYCAIDINDGFDFSEEALVVTVSFRVKDTASGSTRITNLFDEIFTFENEEEDLTPNDYEWREVVTVNTYSENTSRYKGIDVNSDSKASADNADDEETPDSPDTADIGLTLQALDSTSADNNNKFVIIGISAVAVASAVGLIIYLLKKGNE